MKRGFFQHVTNFQSSFLLQYNVNSEIVVRNLCDLRELFVVFPIRKMISSL